MTMQTIFTFGFGQTDPRTGRALDNRFVRVDAPTTEVARRIMVNRFGRGSNGFGNWAFDYETDEAAGVARFGLVEIDLHSGRDLLA